MVEIKGSRSFETFASPAWFRAGFICRHCGGFRRPDADTLEWRSTSRSGAWTLWRQVVSGEGSMDCSGRRGDRRKGRQGRGRRCIEQIDMQADREKGPGEGRWRRTKIG
jgi:hypothetical protein